MLGFKNLEVIYIRSENLCASQKQLVGMFGSMLDELLTLVKLLMRFFSV